MKLAQLKPGDKFVFAQYPSGAPYVVGSAIPKTVGTKYYVFSTTIGYVYQGDWDDEVIKVGNINDD